MEAGQQLERPQTHNRAAVHMDVERRYESLRARMGAADQRRAGACCARADKGGGKLCVLVMSGLRPTIIWEAHEQRMTVG